jgi:hypothetical protein
MAQNYKQSSSNFNSVKKIADPINGRSNSKDELKFCTGEVQVIGVHLGFLIGTYSNKDGSGGLFISNGSSCFHVDENRNVHIKTGKSADDGANGGNLVLGSDDFIQTVRGGYAIEISGTDDKTTASKDGKKQEKEPAYSIKIYGDANIVTTGGDLKLSGDNVLINAKEQVKITAGSQILATSGDGSGKIDLTGGEVKTTAKFAKFDLTGSFTVNGPEEIAFNQKLAVDPIEGSVKINTPGATTAVNTMGSKSTVMIGPEKISSTGNLQLQGYKVLTQSIGGLDRTSLGPFSEFSLSQYEGTFVGSPRENSRALNAYDLYVGGTIGTSYSLTAMDVNLDSLGTISGRSVSIVDFIGTLILLN